jgi:hypothetical protein
LWGKRHALFLLVLLGDPPGNWEGTVLLEEEVVLLLQEEKDKFVLTARGER